MTIDHFRPDHRDAFTAFTPAVAERFCKLEHVCALADDPAFAETASLVDAVAELVESLLGDIAHEEQWIAELVELVEHGHVQMTA
jgi:hypothetical protein